MTWRKLSKPVSLIRQFYSAVAHARRLCQTREGVVKACEHIVSGFDTIFRNVAPNSDEIGSCFRRENESWRDHFLVSARRPRLKARISAKHLIAIEQLATVRLFTAAPKLGPKLPTSGLPGLFAFLEQ